MNTSRLLIAAACSLTVIGASSVAFAQTTPDTSNSGTMNQNPNRNQTQGQSSDRTSTTAPGNTNATTRQSEAARGTDTTDTSGSRMGRSSDDAMRQSGEGSTMRPERLARADRN